MNVARSKRRVGGEAVPWIDDGDARTITVGAVQKLLAAARATCEITRQLREDTRDICQQASVLRSTASRVVAERRSRSAARVA